MIRGFIVKAMGDSKLGVSSVAQKRHHKSNSFRTSLLHIVQDQRSGYYLVVCQSLGQEPHVTS